MENFFSRFRRPRTIAVMGAFRSGTNYVRYLLEHNYFCRVSYNAYGWKHAGVPILNQASPLRYPEHPIVFIAKNPHSFCASLYAYFIDKGRNIAALREWPRFLREPITIFDTDALQSPQLRFANPVQYWNYLYWNLAFLPPGRFIARGLRYEQLLLDPEREIMPVAESLGLSRRRGPFAVPVNELHRMSDAKHSEKNPYTVSTRMFDGAKYSAQRYLEQYTTDELAFVRHEADQRLLEALGYRADDEAS